MHRWGIGMICDTPLVARPLPGWHLSRIAPVLCMSINRELWVKSLWRVLQCKAMMQSGALLYCWPAEQRVPAIKGHQQVNPRKFLRAKLPTSVHCDAAKLFGLSLDFARSKLSKINEDVLREGFWVRMDRQVELSTILYTYSKNTCRNRFRWIFNIMGIGFPCRDLISVIN